MSTFADHGIDIPHTAARPEVATTCPKCSHQRRKKGAKCLSVNIHKRAWHCNHCGWAGGLSEGSTRPHDPHHWRRPKYRRPDPRPQLTLPQNAIDWFRSRGITDAVLSRNRIDYGRSYMPQVEDHVEALIFPYFRNGELVNRKYRTIAGKHFRLETGCELVLYGLDDIEPEKPLIWVEGEIDKLSVEVAGFRNVVSVPNGAPPTGAKNYSASFGFLDADRERIESVKRHIIAVDSDAPGARLEEELARRLGVEKCSRVTWPDGCKDANDVLRKHGDEELRWFIDNADPFPIEGVFEISDRRQDVLRLYDQGFERGYRTGYRELDRYYTVRPGEFTGVTGIPGSGKTELLNDLFVNLAKLHGWRFALFSPENLPLEQHMAAIAEKYIRKPFHDGPTPRMSPEELEAAMAWVSEHFSWIMPSSEDDWTLEKILATAGQLCLRRGIRGLVIDPWNELEALRPNNMTETEYISQSLKRVRVFARQRGVHVWIVIHPAKLYRNENGKYPVPSLYDCAGSAHWRNKVDNGLVVWRDLSQPDSPEVQIHVQKIPFRHVGRRGIARLYYEPVCATYRDYEPMPARDITEPRPRRTRNERHEETERGTT
jgi:twinkle protein